VLSLGTPLLLNSRSQRAVKVQGGSVFVYIGVSRLGPRGDGFSVEGVSDVVLE
jgi:hypothetical protein